MKLSVMRVETIALALAIVCIYILPTDYLDSIGLPIHSYLLGVFLILTASIYYFTTRIPLSNLIYLVLMVSCMIYQKSILPVVILSPIITKAYFTTKNKEYIIAFLMKSRLVDVAALCVLIYGYLYYRTAEKFIFTGVNEINTSGLAVFLLGLIYLKRKKIIGIGILLLGLLTFSRNYYLAIAIMLVINIFLNAKSKVKSKLNKIQQKWTQWPIFNYFFIMISAGCILYMLGIMVQSVYLQGGVLFESSFSGRISNLFDLSNYYRFTVIVILVNVFVANPYLWIVGCPLDKYRELCSAFAIAHGYRYVGNNPHNFLFSYVKLFGFAGLFDIWLISKYIKTIVNTNNFGVYLAIAAYTIILSVGFNGEWLFLSASVLLLYEGNPSIGEFSYKCAI